MCKHHNSTTATNYNSKIGHYLTLPPIHRTYH